MRIEYDPSFIEQAVFLAARHSPEKECVLHQQLDPHYGIADGELRHRAFRETSGMLFRQFGLDGYVPGILREYPLMWERLPRCIVREAERARAQCVDLYSQQQAAEGDDQARCLVMALCPESFLAQDRLTPWLRRQLQHVEDMLDERFAYEPCLPSVTPVQQNLIRDRYGVLWDVYVEGRLIRAGKLAESAAGALWSSFRRVLGGGAPSECGPADPICRSFEWMLSTSDVTHRQILRWASDPGGLLRERGENANVELATASVAT